MCRQLALLLSQIMTLFAMIWKCWLYYADKTLTTTTTTKRKNLYSTPKNATASSCVLLTDT